MSANRSSAESIFEVLADPDDLDVGVHRLHPVSRGIDLGPAEVLDAVEDLALEVGEIHDIEIDQAKSSDPGRGEVKCDR